MIVTPLEIIYDEVGLLSMQYSAYILRNDWVQRLTDYS